MQTRPKPARASVLIVRVWVLFLQGGQVLPKGAVSGACLSAGVHGVDLRHVKEGGLNRFKTVATLAEYQGMPIGKPTGRKFRKTRKKRMARPCMLTNRQL